MYLAQLVGISRTNLLPGRTSMKIGIDASRLRAGTTGAGRYAEGILSSLSRAMPGSTFVLYAKGDCRVSLPSDKWSVECDRHPIWSRLPTIYWIHYRLGALARSGKLDVLWAPNTLIPRGVSNIVPCVTTVLDFCHVLDPANLPPITRFGPRWWFDADVRKADAVVAISEGTAMRMEALLGRRADAIALPAVPALPVIADREGATRALAQFGIRQPFLLTVGKRPCKNLAGAIGAVAKLKAQGSLVDYQLVMAGAEMWGGHDRSRGENAFGWIKPLGYVDDKTLASLYLLTEALIFPSFYEGFGIPVLEARAVGCRVVTTDSPELREAGGGDATYVEPTPEGIAAGLEYALSRPAPSPCKPNHDWDDAANAMATVFRKIARRG